MGGFYRMMAPTNALPAPRSAHEFSCSDCQQTVDCIPELAHAMEIAGPHLIVGGKGGALKVFDMESGETSFTLEGHSYDANALCVVGSTLFSGADAKGSEGWSVS